MQRGHTPEGPLLFVEALNLGPIPNRVGLTFIRKNWIKRKIIDRKKGSAMVYPDFNHWAATKASAKLEVGDTANFVFPYTSEMFLREDFQQIGVADGFGRVHWSSRVGMREARKKHKKAFPSAPEP